MICRVVVLHISMFLKHQTGDQHINIISFQRYFSAEEGRHVSLVHTDCSALLQKGSASKNSVLFLIPFPHLASTCDSPACSHFTYSAPAVGVTNKTVLAITGVNIRGRWQRFVVHFPFHRWTIVPSDSLSALSERHSDQPLTRCLWWICLSSTSHSAWACNFALPVLGLARQCLQKQKTQFQHLILLWIHD